MSDKVSVQDATWSGGRPAQPFPIMYAHLRQDGLPASLAQVLHLPIWQHDPVAALQHTLGRALDEQHVVAARVGLAQHAHGLAVTVKLEQGDDGVPAQVWERCGGKCGDTWSRSNLSSRAVTGLLHRCGERSGDT